MVKCAHLLIGVSINERSSCPIASGGLRLCTCADTFPSIIPYALVAIFIGATATSKVRVSSAADVPLVDSRPPWPYSLMSDLLI